MLKLNPLCSINKSGEGLLGSECQEKPSPVDGLFIYERNDEIEVGLLLSLHVFYHMRTDYFFLYVIFCDVRMQPQESHD